MTARSRLAHALRSTADRVRPTSFRGTIVASTAALMALAMVLVGLGLQLLLARTAQRDINRVLEEQSEATLTVIDQASTQRLTVPTDTLEPGMEVYDGDGVLVAGSIGRSARDAAEDLAAVDRTTSTDAAGGSVRILATPFTTSSGDTGVIVASEETEPYERSEFYALIATIVLGVLVTVATALISLRVTRQALQPVTQMARRAADWSEHDLGQRFDLGPPSNELAALGETLDHLLDRVAAAIRSEQRLTAELAHELRTPLTAIQGSADLALLRGTGDDAAREDLQQIAASARAMATVISTLLDVARDGAHGRDRTTTFQEVVTAVVDPVLDRVVVEVDLDSPRTTIAAPVELVARAVAPLVENAVRHATGSIHLRAVDHPDQVELTVVDDGPGVDASGRGTLFEPGVTSASDGAGLGLGIARRVARSFGGDVDLGDEPSAGAAFVVRLPRR